MNTALAVVTDTQELKPVRVNIWREWPLTEDMIFRGQDEAGRSGWFLRLTVTGLYPRRVGPYRTMDQALEVLEEFLCQVQIEPLCHLENDQTVMQAYVIEGVPTLKNLECNDGEPTTGR